MTVPDLARLETVELRTAWTSESGDFTPWLAKDENLSLLSDTLGIPLELEAQEKSVGPFSADILCREPGTDHWVLIENQLEQTDHTHLGQIITYAAGLNALTVIWIAPSFVDEHRAALDWLNDNTAEGLNFFGVEIQLWRIGDSPFAPRFNIVSRPNAWTKQVRTTAEPRFKWDEPRFMAELSKLPKDADVAKEIIDWARVNMPACFWGSGRVMGSFTPGLDCGGYWHQVIGVWTNGYVELQFAYMQSKPPFSDEAKRAELAEKFVQASFPLADDAIKKRPSVEFRRLYDPEARKRFFEVLDWFVAEVKAFHGE